MKRGFSFFLFLIFSFCVLVFDARATDIKLPLFGRIMDAEDNPIEGEGFFKVLICEDDGDVVYSTSGTETVCEEPDDVIAVDGIVNGYYSFSLGDTEAFADMEPMTVAMVSSSVDRFVTIWFGASEEGPFEDVGTLQMASMPSASNTDYFGGLALDQFLLADSTISTTVIEGTLPASQVEGFSDDARDLTLGDSVSSESVAIKANTTTTEDKPAIRYEATLGQWQISNNGTDFSAITTASDMLSDDSVTSAKILDGTIVAADLASDSVAAAEILADAVGASEIAASGVTAGTYTIATMTVDADGRVTSASNGSVSETGDISSIGDATTGDAFIDGTNNGTKLIYEGSSVDDFENILSFTGNPTADTIVTIPNTTGTLVTTGDVGTVSSTMLVGDAVTSAKITDGVVSAADLATDSVASDEIVDGTIVAADLASDSVAAAEILADAVGASEIAASGVTAGTYTIATMTVDADGRVTSASNGSVSETGDISSIGDATTGDAFIDGTNNGTKLIYEGSSVDDFENILSFTGNPTADTIVTIPNTTGTLVTTGDADTVTGGMINESSLVLTGLVDDDDLAAAAVDGGSGGEIADDTITADDLSATLTLSDADLVDFSAVNASSTTEGVKLPQATDVSAAMAEGQVSWDSDGDTLYVGTGSAVKGMNRVEDRSSSTTTVSGTTTETSVYSYSLPANALGSTGALRVTLFGTYTNTSGSNRRVTVTIKLGSTTLYQDDTGNLSSNANTRAVQFSFLLMNAASTSSQKLAGHLMFGNAGATTSGTGELGSTATTNVPIYGSASEDTTSAKTLDVTVTHSNNSSSISFVRQAVIAELLP